MEETTLKLQACCQHLRHKMMYCDAQHAARGRVDDSSDTRVFFCVKTGDALGPDGRAACPNDCGVRGEAGRVCWERAILGERAE